MAVVFTVALLLLLFQDLQPWTRGALLAVVGATWLAFAATYLWLLRLAPDRRGFVRTNVLDLMVVALPPLRFLTAMRLIFLLAVAVGSGRQVVAVLRHRGLGKGIVLVLALTLIGGFSAFALEPETFTSVGDALWWVLVTSTTVGYGDFVPAGAAARLIAVIVMFLGIGLAGVITANIVDYLSTQGRRPAALTQTVATCTRCEETADRLSRMEAQLALLLAQRPDSGRDP